MLSMAKTLRHVGAPHCRALARPGLCSPRRSPLNFISVTGSFLRRRKDESVLAPKHDRPKIGTTRREEQKKKIEACFWTKPATRAGSRTDLLSHQLAATTTNSEPTRADASRREPCPLPFKQWWLASAPPIAGSMSAREVEDLRRTARSHARAVHSG